jgi:hypothetical protein
MLDNGFSTENIVSLRAASLAEPGKDGTAAHNPGASQMRDPQAAAAARLTAVVSVSQLVPMRSQVFSGSHFAAALSRNCRLVGPVEMDTIYLLRDRGGCHARSTKRH